MGHAGARQAEAAVVYGVLACHRTMVVCGYPVASASLFRSGLGVGVKMKHPTAERPRPPSPLRFRRRCDGIAVPLVTPTIGGQS